jgi:hypothetical protein
LLANLIYKVSIPHAIKGTLKETLTDHANLMITGSYEGLHCARTRNGRS